jgi:hypothetical protein
MKRYEVRRKRDDDDWALLLRILLVASVVGALCYAPIAFEQIRGLFH